MNIQPTITLMALRTSKVLHILLVALLFSLPCAASPDKLDKTQEAAIEVILQQAMAAGHFPSTVTLIDRGGETIYEKALGTANLEFDIPATMSIVYGIGSIAKSFTGLAITQLAYEDKLDMDRPFTLYLPDYEGPGATATVRQLLNHTSGIPNYTSEIKGIRQGLKRNAYSREQMVDFFDSEPLLFETGSKWSYSNSGYYLAGLIIEAVSGMDYYDYIQVNILDPLEMTRTYKGDDAEIIKERAAGYGANKDGYINAPTWNYLVPFSAGSLVSTASDLVKYRRGVFHSDHFSPGLRKLLLETSTMNGGEENFYTTGLILSDFEGYKKISHAGDIWGYTANHAYYPDEDVTIITLSNRQVSAPALSSVEAKIARIVFGIPQPEIQDLVQDEETLERYAGDYKLHPFIIAAGKFGFIAKEGKLFIRFGGIEAKGPMIPLLAQGNNQFRASFDDEWIFEFQSKAGENKASVLVSSYRDGTFSGYRKD